MDDIERDDKMKITGQIDAARVLLAAGQDAVAGVLPDFIGDALEEDAVRERIVKAADMALVHARPEARLVPEPARQRIVRRMLDLMLDEILLPGGTTAHRNEHQPGKS